MSKAAARPAAPRKLHPANLRRARGELSERDPQLAPVIAAHGAARIRPARSPDPFLSLLRAIIYQQLSGKAAGRIHARFLQLFGAAGPTPTALSRLPAEQLRGAGLSNAKTLAVADLARHYQAGQLPHGTDLAALSDEQIIEAFVQVRGIGRWTVEMMLIFELGRPDVLPLNDLGIRRGWMRIRGADTLPGPGQLSTDGALWRPWRSVAAWYLWRAAEA